MSIEGSLSIMPRSGAPSSWWPEGASLAIDFTAGLAVENGMRCAATDLLACTRMSADFAPSKTGILHPFPSDRLRMTNRGLLIEETRQNLLLNSLAPVNQSVGLSAGDFVLSIGGSGMTVASGDATGIADATSPLAFTLGASGTVSLTVSGDVAWFQLEVGAFPTSPIETGASPVTRESDVVSFRETGWLDPQDCTLLLEWEQVAPSSSVQNLIRWHKAAAHRLRSGSAAQVQVKDAEGALILNAGTSPTPPLSGVHRLAAALAPDDMAVAWSPSIDGSGGLSTDNSGTPEGGVPNGIYLGSATGSGEFLNGWLRRLVYWPERLSDLTLTKYV